MKPTKTIVIDSCEDCPYHIFDDGEEPRRWGKHWCTKMDIEVPDDTIPQECPLP